VRECLLKTEIVNINECYEITIEFSYDDLKNIDYILNNISIIKKNFNEKIRYTIRLKEEEIEILNKLEKVLIIKKEETYFLE
jgi:putative IMPACT (imprinted ancient) family translation regulator